MLPSQIIISDSKILRRSPPDPAGQFPRKTREMFGAKPVAHPIPHSTIEVGGGWLKLVVISHLSVLVKVSCMEMG